MIKRILSTMGTIVLPVLFLAACVGTEAIPAVATVATATVVEPAAELTTLVAPNPTAVASGITPQEAVIDANITAADVAAGEQLFTRSLVPSCTECHVEDASTRARGPLLTDFRDEAGTRIEGQDAYTYAYNSIRYANDFVLDGYEADVMRIYDGILTDQEVYELIAYIWTLGDE